MKPRAIPLLTGGQAAKLLNVTASRISQLKLQHGMPCLRVAGGDRFDAEAIATWFRTFKGDSYSNGTTTSTTFDDDNSEALRRMVPVVNRAIREHVAALQQSEGCVGRLGDLLRAIGITDTREVYLASRAAMFWVGTSTPGDVALLIPSWPVGSPESKWEAEFVAAVRGVLVSGR